MAEWDVAPAVMGLAIFSSGLLGVGLGLVALLAPAADRYGRRPTILLGLVMITVGMLAVWVTTTPAQLSGLRFLTGLGIGTLLPTLNTLVAEYTPIAWQSLTVSIYATGYPIGAALSGIVAPSLIEHIGWRAVYVGGGSVSIRPCACGVRTASGVVGVSAEDPASWARLERARVIAARLQIAPPETLPPPAATVRSSPLTPFQRGLATRTALIGAAFFLLWVTEFFIVNWTPAILNREGFTLASSALGGVMLTLGGMAGTLLVGAFGVRFGIGRVCVVYLTAGFLMTLVFAFTSHPVQSCPSAQSSDFCCTAQPWACTRSLRGFSRSKCVRRVQGWRWQPDVRVPSWASPWEAF